MLVLSLLLLAGVCATKKAWSWQKHNQEARDFDSDFDICYKLRLLGFVHTRYIWFSNNALFTERDHSITSIEGRPDQKLR
jgi:hypothetical protein